MQTSGAMRREIAKLYPRHCERGEAIHLSACRAMDCFAALAMTRKRRGVLDPHRSLSSGAQSRDPVAGMTVEFGCNVITWLHRGH